MARRYWLMKSEPDVFSFNDLLASPADRLGRRANYQARNLMRDDFRWGTVLYYHRERSPGSWGSRASWRGTPTRRSSCAATSTRTPRAIRTTRAGTR